jgi:hypothetical protein
MTAAKVQDQPTPGGDPGWLRGLIAVLRVRRVGVGVQDACAFLGGAPTPPCSPKVIAPRNCSDTRRPVGPNNR